MQLARRLDLLLDLPLDLPLDPLLDLPQDPLLARLLDPLLARLLDPLLARPQDPLLDLPLARLLARLQDPLLDLPLGPLRHPASCPRSHPRKPRPRRHLLTRRLKHQRTMRRCVYTDGLCQQAMKTWRSLT
jgi:hypothetical protein